MLGMVDGTSINRPHLTLSCVNCLQLQPSNLGYDLEHFFVHITVHLHCLDWGVVHTVQVGGLQERKPGGLIC